MLMRVDHVEIVPEDFDRTIAFYEGVLGFEVVQRQEMAEGPLKRIAYLRLGDGVVEMLDFDDLAHRPQVPTVGYRALALEVDSMEATIAELEEKGVPITWGPIDLGGSIRAEIKDPDGLTIELREWVKRPW